MLLVANFGIKYKMIENTSKLTEILGTHLRVLSQSYIMNTQNDRA